MIECIRGKATALVEGGLLMKKPRQRLMDLLLVTSCVSGPLAFMTVLF